MRFTTTALIATLFLTLLSTFGYGQEFSADVVYLEPNGSVSASHPTSKLYVSKDKFRLETNGFTGTILLVDRADQANYVLQPKKKVYQPLASGPSEYFRVGNPDDACASWQSASAHKIVCEKVDTEMINGRETVKYQNKGASEAATAAVWVDKTLKFVVKWQAADTAAELRNIKEEKQAEALFSVPSDYKTATPQKGSKGFSHR
jgi:hypothetical protein